MRNGVQLIASVHCKRSSLRRPLLYPALLTFWHRKTVFWRGLWRGIIYSTYIHYLISFQFCQHISTNGIKIMTNGRKVRIWKNGSDIFGPSCTHHRTPAPPLWGYALPHNRVCRRYTLPQKYALCASISGRFARQLFGVIIGGNAPKASFPLRRLTI